MPVTARLSRKFYETFGDDIANELVDWFNQVDATYRADLREFNELNFQRFDAKLEQRLSEFRIELRTGFNAGIAALRDEVMDALAKQHKELAAIRGSIRTERESLKAELVRYLFSFWIGTLIPLAGLIIGLHTLGN